MYLIVKSSDVKVFEAEVNAKLAQGYECVGGVSLMMAENPMARNFVNASCDYFEYFAQAMQKKSKP